MGMITTAPGCAIYSRTFTFPSGRRAWSWYTCKSSPSNTFRLLIVVSARSRGCSGWALDIRMIFLYAINRDYRYLRQARLFRCLFHLIPVFAKSYHCIGIISSPTKRRSVNSLHEEPGSREPRTETASFARLAGDLQFCLVAVEHMLDNGKTQTRTSRFAR